MSCFVTISTKVLDINGASKISSCSVIPFNSYDSMPTEILMDKERIDVDFNNKLLHEIMDEKCCFKEDFKKSLETMSQEDINATLSKYKNVANANGDTIAHIMISRGQNISLDIILQLGNPSNEQGETLAHWMVRSMNKHYSPNEINILGNPIDGYGNSLAHWMYRHGHRFSVDDVCTIGDPKGATGRPLSHQMVLDNVDFSLKDIQRLKNPTDEEGNTLAHIIITTGKLFSADEIVALHNPSNLLGETLTDWMVMFGYRFFESEKKIIGIH